MKLKKADFANKGKASDTEVNLVADEIFNLLKEFQSPKDAGSSLALAHYRVILAAFPPENLKEAVESIEAHSKLIIQLLEEGWQ